MASGKAALIAPIKVRDQPIGVISVARQEHRPFSERSQAMLEAVADYASISLVNARLFQALEERARRLHKAIEDTQVGVPTSNEMLGLLDRRLRHIREVAHLLTVFRNPG
jgi:GAF domain-containing protein